MKKILSLITAAALTLGTTTAFAEADGEQLDAEIYIDTHEDDAEGETNPYSINADLNDWDEWVQIPAEVFKDVTTDTVVTINCDAYTAEKDNWWNVKFCRLDAEEAVGIDDLQIEDDGMYFASTGGGYALDQGTSKISFRFSDKETVVNGEKVCGSLEAVKQSGLGICGHHVMLQDMTFENRPASDSISVDGRYLIFTELDDQTLEVTGSESATLQEIEIPAVFNGKRVTSIGEGAFEKRRQLTKVTLPDGITKIGEFAFNECRNLTSINIPESVKSIEHHSFRNCAKISSINLPDSLEYIGNFAFLCCDLSSVKIPKNVTGIGRGAFGACPLLTEIVVDADNTSFRAENGVLFSMDKTALVHYPSGNSSQSYTIPDSVTSIAAAAFEGATKLTSVTIPDSVEEIGDFAFECCEGLTSVKIPNGIKVISYGTFNYCPSMKSVTIPASVETIEHIAFDGCTNITDIYYGGSEENWSNIDIAEGNDPLLNAAITYNSTGPADVEVKVTINISDKVSVDISNQSVKVSGGGVDVTIKIDDGVADLSSLANGTYTFTFSAKNCVPRDYKDVTIEDGEVSGLDDVELNLYGDMDGDGEIELTDVMDTYLTLRKQQSKSEYMRAVADANHKDGLNISDVMDVFLHLRGKSSLWN